MDKFSSAARQKQWSALYLTVNAMKTDWVEIPAVMKNYNIELQYPNSFRKREKKSLEDNRLC